MTYTLTDADITNVKQLIEFSSLSSIETHEATARRYDSPDESLEEDKADLEVSIQFRMDNETFGIRLVCDFKLRGGCGKAVVSGEYKHTVGDAISARNVQLFSNEVAVMTIFPYLRAEVSTMSAKVFGAPLLLPIAERGDISFEIEPLK